MINSLPIPHLSTTQLGNLYEEIKKTGLKLTLIGQSDDSYDVEILGLENELNLWVVENGFWLEYLNQEPAGKHSVRDHYVDERLRNLDLVLVRKDFSLEKNLPVYYFTSPNKVYLWYTNSLDYSTTQYGSVTLSGTVKVITDSHVVLTRCKLG